MSPLASPWQRCAGRPCSRDQTRKGNGKYTDPGGRNKKQREVVRPRGAGSGLPVGSAALPCTGKGVQNKSGAEARRLTDQDPKCIASRTVANKHQQMFTAKVAPVFPLERLMTHFVCKLAPASSPLAVLWLAGQEAPAFTEPFRLDRPINFTAGFFSQGLVRILEV